MKISKCIEIYWMIYFKLNQLYCDTFRILGSQLFRYQKCFRITVSLSRTKKHTRSQKFWKTFSHISHTHFLKTYFLQLYFNIPFRDTILEMNLDEVLLNVHDTEDNAAWELIDQALTILKDIAPYSKKSVGSTIQSDDGSGPSTSQPSDKSVPVKRK